MKFLKEVGVFILFFAISLACMVVLVSIAVAYNALMKHLDNTVSLILSVSTLIVVPMFILYSMRNSRLEEKEKYEQVDR